MTEPEIPPGHTREPNKTDGPLLPERERKLLRSYDPRHMPRQAKGVLALAAGLSFLAGVFLAGGTVLVLVAVICGSAYGESMRHVRDARDDGSTPGFVPDIFERAVADAIWVGLSIVAGVIAGAAVRRLSGFEGMLPG